MDNDNSVVSRRQVFNFNSAIGGIVNQFRRNFSQAVSVDQFDSIITGIVFNTVVNHNICCIIGYINNRFNNNRRRSLAYIELGSSNSRINITVTEMINNNPVITGRQITDPYNTIGGIVNQLGRNIQQSMSIDNFNGIITGIVFNAVVNHNICCVVGYIDNRFNNDRRRSFAYIELGPSNSRIDITVTEMINNNSVITGRQITDPYNTIGGIVNQLRRNIQQSMSIDNFNGIIAGIVFNTIIYHNVGSVISHVCNRIDYDAGACPVYCEVSSGF